MMASDSFNADNRLADGAGLFASIACAIHCAAMPLVIGYLPMLGLSWLADPAFHRVMAVACFALALAAFWPGWRRHGSLAPAAFGATGVGLLALAAFALEGECCAACAATTPAGETDGAVTCTAACCADPGGANLEAAGLDSADAASGAVASVATTHENAAAPDADATALAWMIPLITPMGGVLLVAGHLTNHRRSCGCCRTNGCEGHPSHA